MRDKFEHLTGLILKCMHGEATETELTELRVWASSTPEIRQWLEQKMEEDQIAATLVEFNNIEIERPLGNVLERIDKYEKNKKNYKRIGYTLITAAAAVLIFIGIKWWSSASSTTMPANTIAQKDSIGTPLSNKAALVLEDGTQYILTDSVNKTIVKRDNWEISQKGWMIMLSRSGNQVSNITYATLIVPRKGKFQLQLADGSKVWVNSASSLRFAIQDTGNIRMVAMTGEAYFEVKRNEAKPFVVQVDGVVVKALGTRFNINAYKDNWQIKTTLLEGKLKVAYGAKEDTITSLQSIVIVDGNLMPPETVTENDTLNITQWRSGCFRFDGEDLASVVRQLARWYDLKTDIRKAPSIPISYSGFRTRSIDFIIKDINSIDPVNIHITRQHDTLCLY